MLPAFLHIALLRKPIKLMKYFAERPAFFSGLLIFSVFISGCSSEGPDTGQIAAVNNSNIQKLTNLYSAFQISRYGPGPKDETEFKHFIKNEMGSYHLGLMQIDANNIDDIFISERDHKPLKVRYGVNGGPGVVNVLVFEEEGLNGKKQVGLNGGTVMEVDDTQYNEMWSGKWHPAKTADVNSLPNASGKAAANIK